MKDKQTICCTFHSFLNDFSRIYFVF